MESRVLWSSPISSERRQSAPISDNEIGSSQNTPVAVIAKRQPYLPKLDSAGSDAIEEFLVKQRNCVYKSRAWIKEEGVGQKLWTLFLKIWKLYKKIKIGWKSFMWVLWKTMPSFFQTLWLL